MNKICTNGVRKWTVYLSVSEAPKIQMRRSSSNPLLRVSIISNLKLKLRQTNGHTPPMPHGISIYTAVLNWNECESWAQSTAGVLGVCPWPLEQNRPVFGQPHDQCGEHQCLDVKNRPSTAFFNITWRKTAVFAARQSR